MLRKGRAGISGAGEEDAGGSRWPEMGVQLGLRARNASSGEFPSQEWGFNGSWCQKN